MYHIINYIYCYLQVRYASETAAAAVTALLKFTLKLCFNMGIILRSTSTYTKCVCFFFFITIENVYCFFFAFFFFLFFCGEAHSSSVIYGLSLQHVRETIYILTSILFNTTPTKLRLRLQHSFIKN